MIINDDSSLSDDEQSAGAMNAARNALIQSIPWSKGDPSMLFKLETVLDEGAFGVVWRGKLKANQSEVAVKMMPMSEEVLAELKSEVNFLNEFNSPFVIHFHGAWYNQRSDEIWIVMELAELGSFEGIMIFCDYIFTEAELAAFFARVLLGLDYIHKKGLVHQDIKAKNILLTLKGEVKLADFGVAASVTNVNQNRGTVSGSPHWMAPEILSGVEITQMCDIWSLGITMLEMTQGAPPHSDIDPVSVISVIPVAPAPRFDNPDKWSSNIKAFMKRMLEKDPNKRRSAARLMKHPFVKAECAKALSGNHKILKALAENCFETVQRMRTDLEAGGGVIGEIEDGSDFESSEYETEESSDDGFNVIINKGDPKLGTKGPIIKKPKPKDSLISLVVDETMFEKVKKKRKTGKTTGGLNPRTRNLRGTRAGRRSKSLYSQTGIPSGARLEKSNPKISMLKKNKNYEIDMNQITHRKDQDDETIRKAEELLGKIMKLTNRKQL